MLYNIFCVLLLVSQCLSFEIFSEDKRQGLIPLPRFGRDNLWTLVEEKKQSGGMMPYPRLGREIIFELPQTVIPYPRAGRNVLDGDNFFYDYEVLTMPSFEEWLLAPSAAENGPLIKKRGKLAFTPRIGRKKRSIPEDHPSSNDHFDDQQKRNSLLTANRPFDFERLVNVPDFNNEDLFYRPSRQQYRSRNAFIPRVGKKSSYLEDVTERDNVNSVKRAVAFTPRIGRAALIPRIGRNDDRLMSRGAFIPRIGRRADLAEHSKEGHTNSD